LPVIVERIDVAAEIELAMMAGFWDYICALAAERSDEFVGVFGQFTSASCEFAEAGDDDATFGWVGLR
jgi:hypothetical protein